uniref:Elongin-B n=1 Tax=Sus scrofa TaxID=9823 RepID=A0A8D1T9N8_PIG
MAARHRAAAPLPCGLLKMAASGPGAGRGRRARGTLGCGARAAGNGEERGRAGASRGRGSRCDGERARGEGRRAGAGAGGRGGHGGHGPRGGSPGSALTPARRPQDVFLMIRRHKTTIFTDAKESSTVFELKRIVEGILKRPPDEQRLYKDDQLLDDGKTLGECGFTSQTARPQAPATVGLAFRADEAFEALRIEPFSSPPELPDVMKPQDSGSSANEQAVQ